MSAAPINAAKIEKGYLVKPEEESVEAKRIPLHFNPLTLSYSVEASQQQQNQPKPAGQAQFTAQYSAKLSFDALFDNTDTGVDIRITTNQIVQFLQPSPGASQTKGANAPPLLLFHWGAFRFTGLLTAYKETIEFFSKEGVPLRSSVSLTLLKQDKVLELEQDKSAKNNPAGSLVPTGGGDSALSAATRGGDPTAARALASANGLESLRFTGGATLQVGGGAGASASAGFAGGASADASANWNASGSGNLFGAQSSAGVSASGGAFAGISVSGAAGGSTAGLDAAAMLSSSSRAYVAAHAGASFSLGGAAQMEASIGLSADVGANANWKDLLQFDEG